MSNNRPDLPNRLASIVAWLLLLCAIPMAVCSDAPVASTAFVHVNVVPMDKDRVLSNQTVVVEQGTITAIGPSVAIPQNARIIDGRGELFLSPGLADMHTHSQSRDDLAIYLANGVTTVLNMGGASSNFVDQTMREANDGKLPSPHVYIGFMVDGSPQYANFFVTTPDEARGLVHLAKTNGYDFIKVYTDLSPECFDAIIDEAKREHMGVIGHSVLRVGLRRQLEAGQVMVAHTEEFLYGFFSPNRSDDEIPAAIELIKKNDAFVTADLVTYTTIAKQWGKPEVVKAFLEDPNSKYVGPERRLRWKRQDYVTRKGTVDPQLKFLAKFTKAMADAGVNLIAGTDAPGIPGVVPGYSLHDDFSLLEQAGLSRYQILSTATRVPGEFISRYVPGAKSFGTVTVGSRADLILSSANPLDGLDTLRRPLGVMVQGHWYTRAELEQLTSDVVKAYAEACHSY